MSDQHLSSKDVVAYLDRMFSGDVVSFEVSKSQWIAAKAELIARRHGLTAEQVETATESLLQRVADRVRASGETAAVTRDTPVVREIFERHDRCSKLLWGPGSLPGMMLGPMDADQAHADRGTLLSLIPGPPRHPKTGSALPDRIMKEPQ